MVTIPAIEDALRRVHAATSEAAFRERLAEAESLTRSMTAAKDADIRAYCHDVLRRISRLRDGRNLDADRSQIITLHKMYAGGQHLIQMLLNTTDVAEGVRMIDEHKHLVDDDVLETLRRETTEARDKFTEVAKAHRLAYWRLHAVSQYYYVTIRRRTLPWLHDEVLQYGGDKTETAESMMLLADVFEEVPQYDACIALCTDALRLHPDLERRMDIALRKARLLRKGGRSSECVAFVKDFRAAAAAQMSAPRLFELVREQATAHLVQRQYDEAMAEIGALRSADLLDDDHANLAHAFELETSLTRQSRRIADGILADMILNPDYYEQVWSKYGSEEVWWSYFADCRRLAPELGSEDFVDALKRFEEDFIAQVVAGDITPCSPTDVYSAEVDVAGDTLRFVHFEQINERLRTAGSAKRLVVQNMRPRASTARQPICEFIFGEVIVEQEASEMDVAGRTYPLLQFMFEAEDVVCPTMTVDINGLNGVDEFGTSWIVIRRSSAARQTRRMMRWLARPADSDDDEQDSSR